MATKKKATRKTATKKKAAAKAAKPATKSEIHGFIAEQTGLSKKDVGAVFEALAVMIKRELKRGPARTARKGRGPVAAPFLLGSRGRGLSSPHPGPAAWRG